MAQYEYQVVEQGGAKVGHFNERIMQLTTAGFEPVMMSGVTPQVSILMRKPLSAQPAQAAAPAAAQAQAPAAPAPPAPPRPTG